MQSVVVMGAAGVCERTEHDHTEPHDSTQHSVQENIIINNGFAPYAPIF